nr:histidine-rich glycoprotein-like [Penaeus vannamei]
MNSCSPLMDIHEAEAVSMTILHPPTVPPASCQHRRRSFNHILSHHHRLSYPQHQAINISASQAQHQIIGDSASCQHHRLSYPQHQAYPQHQHILSIMSASASSRSIMSAHHILSIQHRSASASASRANQSYQHPRRLSYPQHHVHRASLSYPQHHRLLSACQASYPQHQHHRLSYPQHHVSIVGDHILSIMS